MGRFVVVSEESFASDDPVEIVASNFDFVNALIAEHFRLDEIAHDAVLSYHVEYYRLEMNNGGFSQFVYNTGWSSTTRAFVRAGLAAMKATQHLQLFEIMGAIVDQIEAERLTAFLADYRHGNIYTAFHPHNERFYELADVENLAELNAAWLRNAPNLMVIPADDMQTEVESLVAELPDRDEREREALENEPDFMKYMRALSIKAGLSFLRATGCDSNHRHGDRTVAAWHFLTDHGHYFMIEHDRKAIMFDGTTGSRVVDIPLQERFH